MRSLDSFTNRIICGDCLDMMNNMPNGFINLIYIDPPFGFDGDAKFFGMPKWSTLDYPANRIDDILPIIPRDKGTRNYLRWMFDRLEQMRRVLSERGSIYLHCDPTASHYLKLLMDVVFGAEQFLNEIIWYYGPKATQRSISFQRKHDIVFLYAKKQGQHLFSSPLQEYGKGSLAERETRYKHQDEGGVYRWTTRRDGTGQKSRAKVYLNEGVVMTDVWQIPIINATAKERLGYPTQKPEALLDRIIKASSNEGDIVLDPFCGCGTTIAVAERLKKRWIGVDISERACEIARNRIAGIQAQPDLLAAGD